jgi:hypothetical protein
MPGLSAKVTVLKERRQLPTLVKPVSADPVRGAQMDNVTMEVGRRLRLRLSGSTELAYAMVDDVVDGQLHIGVSLAHRRPTSGEIVDIEWGTPRGWYSLPCSFEGMAVGKLDTWLMRAAGPVNILQRRGYVRVEIALSVVIVDDTPPEFAEGEEIPEILPDPPEIGALTLDIGEGGARISVPASFGLTVSQRVRLRLASEELELDAAGQVVRVQQGQSRDEVAICFDQPIKGANELRRAVMRWQARERMMRAG